MRTIHRSYDVFSISELSQHAKEKAYYHWCESQPYSWEDENSKTLKEFENIFPVNVRNWEYGGYCYPHISFEFTENDDIENLHGLRLRTYIINNYGRNLFEGKYFSLWSKKDKNPKNPAIGKLKIRRSKVLFDTSCVLTGYCIDDDILEPIYKFLQKPSDNVTFYELMDDCLNSWVTACNNDFEASTSIEYFEECATENDWEFTEDGEQI